MFSGCSMLADYKDFKGLQSRGAARCWAMAHSNSPERNPPNYRSNLSQITAGDSGQLEIVLPDPSAGYYVKVTVDGTLAGHVFACQTSSYQQQK